MSGPELSSALRATDHDFTAGLRFLDEYAKHLTSRHSFDDRGHQFIPRFDLEEHEKSYEIYGELPGFHKDNINIEANDDRNIQISGWIPRRQGHFGTDTDPAVEVHHNDVIPHHTHHHGPPMERFGEVLNPNRKDPAADGPATNTAATTTTHPDPPTTSSNVPVPTPAAAAAAATATATATPAPVASATPTPTSAAVAPTAHEHKVKDHEHKAHDHEHKAHDHDHDHKHNHQEHGPATARFGDVLDPQAQFVHHAKTGHAGPAAKPKVRFVIAERQYGHFHRAFHFPKPIIRDDVVARMESGVLHISAPKRELGEPRRVEITKVGS